MAWCYVCDACLDGNHDDCEDHTGAGFATGYCNCSHGGSETAFQAKTRKDSERDRAKRREAEALESTEPAERSTGYGPGALDGWGA